MSILQTNTISGLGTNGVEINCPVGIGTNYSTNGVVVSGSVVVENSGAEVVTVASENFGVKIRGCTGPAFVIRNFQYIPNPFESSVFFSGNWASGITSGRRADITSTIQKDIRFNTSYISGSGSLGFTGPVFTAPTSTTEGIYTTNTHSKFSSDTVLKDTVDFGLNSAVNSQATFETTYVPKCSGIAQTDDDIINLELLKRVLFNVSNLKTWSVFGGLDNAGIKLGKGRSGNFFARLFGAKSKCCCGCQTMPGSYNQQAYNEILQGKWICIGFSQNIRSCSCSDNEQVHYPIDYSKVWEINNDSVKNTLPAKLAGTYNLWGFLIKPYFSQ